MRVVYRLEALQDLGKLLSYIAKENPRNAALVGRRITQSIARLELFPASGRKGQTPETFELVIPQLPYIAVYSIRGDVVEIVSIFHTSTNRPRGHR